MTDKLPPDSRPKDAGFSAGRGRNSGRTDPERIERRTSQAVGAIFRLARETQHLSQYQVAELTGGQISRTSISDIERGQNLPGLGALVCLSRVLHVDPLEVIERVELETAAPVDVTGLSFDELLHRAEELFWSTEYRSALAVYDAMADLLALDPPASEVDRRRLRARVEINRAVALRQCSALRASEAAAKRAAQAADSFPDLQAETQMVLASLYSFEEIFVLAKIAAEQAVSLSSSGPAKLQGQAWSQKGNVLFRSGDYEAAREAFLHARQHSLEAKDKHNLASIEGNIGGCLVKLDRRQQARARFRTALKLAKETGDLLMGATWLIELGELAFDDGALEEADRHAHAALRIARQADRVLAVFRAEWLRHRNIKRRTPEEPDTNRLNRLKKLYARVKEHRSLAPIQEFSRYILEDSSHD